MLTRSPFLYLLALALLLLSSVAQLTDQSLPLFERYKAMFSLRNNGSKAAVLALCTGFNDPSPLFRHEVRRRRESVEPA